MMQSVRQKSSSIVCASTLILFGLLNVNLVKAADTVSTNLFAADAAMQLDISFETKLTNQNQYTESLFQISVVGTRVQPLVTYTIERSSDSLVSFTETFSDYFFFANTVDNENQLWQAQFGLFLVNSQNLQSGNSNGVNSGSAVMYNEVNLGFRWGTSNNLRYKAIESYSVLFGYGLADSVELNLGFSSLERDQRIYAQDFYEGTWYAGFSAKF
jgi:hypothetical protein